MEAWQDEQCGPGRGRVSGIGVGASAAASLW